MRNTKRRTNTMSEFATTSRRSLMIGAVGTLFAWSARAAEYEPIIVVNRDPSCGCCGGWIDHLRKANFSVRVVEATNLRPVRARLSGPDDLAACHTGEVSGYVIEGHVPVAAIKRLLAELTTGKGLAVPDRPWLHASAWDRHPQQNTGSSLSRAEIARAPQVRSARGWSDC